MNILSVELFIAIRYLKARKKAFFSVFTTFIAIGGITLGVSTLVITLAIMSGFQSDIRSKILGIQPHIIVTRFDMKLFGDYRLIEEKIKTTKTVIEVTPFIYRQGIIRSSKSLSSSGIITKAIDYKRENKVLNLSKQILKSSMNFNGQEIGEKSIILGNELAKSISVNEGNEVILMFPSNFGSVPKVYKFNVAAIIHSGMYDFDSSLGFIDLKESQSLFSIPEGTITGFDVHTKDFEKAVDIAWHLQKDLHYPYRAKAWIEMNKNLFCALKLEKIMMFIILGLIILVAAFNIISNLLLLSIQKLKEIGIMSAIGFSKNSIAKIFFYEGMIVGLFGIFLGIVLGLAVSFMLKYFDIFKLPKGVYYVDKLPVSIVTTDIFMVVFSAFIITMVAGIYPAYRVSKLDPIEAIKYN
ncbi:MAG: ABC transporter permease [Endomicrobium sp.]|jgi:lipoprotein-releasing system permease protein|nr:ABC transporter permease [Endomicrobium sp.]